MTGVVETAAEARMGVGMEVEAAARAAAEIAAAAERAEEAAATAAGNSVYALSRRCTNPTHRMECRRQLSPSCPDWRPPYGYECCKGEDWEAVAEREVAGEAAAVERAMAGVAAAAEGAMAAAAAAGSSVCAPSRWCANPGRRINCPRLVSPTCPH